MEDEDKFSEADPMVKGTDHNFREQLRSLPVSKGETDKEYAKENVEKIKFRDQNAPAEHGSTTCEISAEAGKDEFESGTDMENKSVKTPEKGILARKSIRETTETMSEFMNLKSTNIAEDRSLEDFMIKECSNVQLNAILAKDFSEGDSTKKDEYLTSELERKQLADSKMKINSTASDKNISESELKNVTTENKSVEQDSAIEAQSLKKVQSTEDGSENSIQICPQTLVNLDKSSCSVAPSSYSRALLPYSPPPGLGNMGNSCYINAVMQCLAVCFQDSLIFEEIERRKTEVGGLAYWFFKVIHEINNSGSNISIMDLKREMGKISPKYASCGQQDAFEFLMFIFKNVEGELKSIGLTIMSDTFSFEIATVLTPACNHEQTTVQREYAIILSPSIKSNQELANELFPNNFQFSLISLLRTLWNLVWRTMTTPELKLDELLEGFFRKEDNYEIFCPTCQDGEELSKGTLEYQLKSPPKILIIYINRYNALKSNKLDESIELKLNDFKVKSSEGLATYSAIAYCEHSGTLQSGHYTAHVRVSHEGPWYKCNDSFIASSRHQSDSIRSRNVYMVFYKKKKTQNLDLSLAAPVQNILAKSLPV